MKKIKLLLIAILGILVIPCMVSAASGTIKVSSSSTIVVGNKVTVYVTLSSGTPIGSWEMSLNYDRSFLQLTSSNTESGGVMMASSVSSGIGSKSYTFTFKTLKTGSTNLAVGSYDAYAFSDLSQMKLTSSGKTIRIITQADLEASYSKNNNLSSLSVEGFTITPEFTTDKTEYSLIVPENTKQITIKATKSDSRASVKGDGVVDLTSGVNSLKVTVNAENGSEKVYTLSVEVKDQFPINVKVDGSDYTVVKIKENLPVINLYEATTIKINDIEVPAYKSTITNYLLVGLKSSDGKISLFIYDEEEKSYQKYNELLFDKMTIYPLTYEKDIKGYKKTKIKINDIETEGYVYKDGSRYVVIYGLNVETGEKALYMCDLNDNTIIKYNDEYIVDLEKKVDLFTYIIIGFIGIVVLTFIIFITMLSKNKKPKVKKEKKEVTIPAIPKSDTYEPKIIKKSNEIVELVTEESDEEEVYDILDKKKKKKKHKK
ncbi:MAG: cadherin-like beta sandwich domain-containing protein [Bacilli bacterium]